MIEQKRTKSTVFCAQMVDFHRPGHIWLCTQYAAHVMYVISRVQKGEYLTQVWSIKNECVKYFQLL